ncbi:hypothetical protein FBZ96_11611 [Bradyrhizobium stylosanthis]|uniref:Uncharacterized protein n=1 Tax=Bradyrhizobium stylosanthis TaxID=1803665 RepID=A0A560CZC0_9BRAD|nr:hypothetical protein FBZ96_11611 [Bradyrhizobium stylosanthis]
MSSSAGMAKGELNCVRDSIKKKHSGLNTLRR